MQVHELLTYPARADEVFAMFTDEAYWHAVADAMRAVRVRVAVTTEDGETVVHVRRTVPAQVPDIVRAFVGSEIEIDQTERWSAADRDGRRAARLLLSIPGRPVRFPASMTLEDDAEGCRQTVSGRIEVKVPFGGGAIAAEIARAIRAGMGVQERVGRRYLLSSGET